MTKDNWIKEFDEQFGFEKGAINMHVSHQYTEMIKSFISQVEKDAIEKTNKRWREKAMVLRDTRFKYINGTDKYFENIGYNQALSDLLEDKESV